MKKFGRKLVLSGLALAATAATLSTSTYAWYVTNNTADVTGGTAATAGTEVGGNLLVAYNDTSASVVSGKEKGAYSNTADLTGRFTPVALDPITKGKAYKKTTDTELTDGKTYYTQTISGTGEAAVTTYDPVETPDVADIATYYEVDDSTYAWVDKDNVAKDGAKYYQEISFWVLSTKSSEITIDASVTNTTTTPVTQTALNLGHAPSSATLNSQFYVDAAQALRFEVIYKQAKATYKLTTDETRVTGKTYYKLADGVYTVDEGTTTEGLYEIDKYVNSATDVSTTYSISEFDADYTALSGALSGGNAHDYYKDIMGKYPTGGTTNPATAGSAFSKLYVEAGVETLITIRVWLDGQDIDCFDSCRGQSFSYDFNLEA